MMRRMVLGSLLLAACGGGGNSPGTDPDAPMSMTDPDAPVTVSDDAPFGDAPPSTVDPAGNGDATVTKHDAMVGEQAITVFQPSTPGPHAAVIILPGFQLARTQYASYAQHLATWGFVVITVDYADQGFSPDHQMLADDVKDVVDYAIATTALGVDPAKIGIAGHSLGGKISVLAASGDSRLKAIVGWDPVDSTTPSVAPELVGALTAPLAVIGETTDATGGSFGMACAPSAESFVQFYAAAHAPAVKLTVATADHMDWVDDPSCFVCGFCTEGTAAPELARAATRRLDVAWFRKQLLGDTSMDAWLLAPPEVAAGAMAVEHK